MKRKLSRSIKNIMAVVMMITLVMGNSVFVRAEEINTKADCSHSFSSWQYNSTFYTSPPTFGDCKVRVTEYIRVCSECGIIEYKYTEYQMTHNWIVRPNGDQICTNCNLTIGTARRAYQ